MLKFSEAMENHTDLEYDLSPLKWDLPVGFQTTSLGTPTNDQK